MKNKQLAYLLLPLALAIWGLIGYKVWLSVGGEEDTPLLPTAAAPAGAPTATPTEQVPTLRLNYADPFQGQRVPEPPAARPAAVGAAPTLATSLGRPSTLPIQTLPAAPPPPPPIQWPALEYRGIIENRQKKTRVAMLAINGSDYLVQERQSQQNVTVLRIYPDSVVLSFQNHQKAVTRQ